MRDGLEVLGIFAADLHLSETPPVARSAEPDWFAAMARPLVELQLLWHGLKHPPIIYCGDIFHKWNPSPEAINFAIKNLPTGYAVAGNHDLPNHNYAALERSAYWTLVEHETLIDMEPDTVHHMSNEWSVQAFPWGTNIQPPAYTSNKNIHIAVIHAYVWKEGHEHPGADKSSHVSQYIESLQGYDGAVSGDNHSSFDEYWKDKGRCFFFNCGCLIPRRSPERHYKPRVGLLMSDGSVREHLLDTSKDVWLDPEETARKVLDDGEGVREFVDLLKRAGNRVLCFDTALRAMISDKTGKIPPEVRSAVLEALEES